MKSLNLITSKKAFRLKTKRFINYSYYRHFEGCVVIETKLILNTGEFFTINGVLFKVKDLYFPVPSYRNFYLVIRVSNSITFLITET